jgi:hypothetical protein
VRRIQRRRDVGVSMVRVGLDQLVRCRIDGLVCHESLRFFKVKKSPARRVCGAPSGFTVVPARVERCISIAWNGETFRLLPVSLRQPLVTLILGWRAGVINVIYAVF